MDSKFDQILEVLIKEFLGQGERVLRAKALEASREAVKAARRALLLHHLLTFTGFLCALSFFGAGFLIAQQWPEPHLNPTLSFSLGLFGVSSLALYLTVREKTWLRALGLDQRYPSESSSGMSPEEIALLVDRILDKKLAELSKPASAEANDSERTAA